MANIIYAANHLQKIETPEGTAVIINKFKTPEMQINIYILKAGGSFHLNPPGQEGAVKSYWVISGKMYSIDEQRDLMPDDLVLLEHGHESFAVFAKEETRLLVHSLSDNAFEKTAENFRYIYNLLCKIQDKDGSGGVG